MQDKTTVEQAMALIRDGGVITTIGPVQSCIPEMQHAVPEIRLLEEEACKKTGRKVNAIVNQNGFRVAEILCEDYMKSVVYLLKRDSVTTAHFMNSAFMHLKMREVLSSRSLRPHIFETSGEARVALEGSGA